MFFFQLYRTKVYNKIYIAVFMAEIMVKLNGLLQANQSRYLKMSPYLCGTLVMSIT